MSFSNSYLTKGVREYKNCQVTAFYLVDKKGIF